MTKIDQMIYQIDCLKALLQKTFESLQSITEKATELTIQVKKNIEEVAESNLSNEDVR